MTCGAIGVHFEDDCPQRAAVGMPESLRATLHDKTVAAVRATHFFPPEHIKAHELLPILRASKLAPSALCCVSCDELALQAIWCSNCDAVVCEPCLGPVALPAKVAEHAPVWACPGCRCIDLDMFFVVGALRALAQQWLAASVAIVDDAASTTTAPQAPAPVQPSRRAKPRAIS